MKKLLLFCIVFTGLLLSGVSFVNAQGVGINPSGAAPDSSAGLDVNFSNKGLLPPRMSTSQRNAISSPATGLQIFNTDCNVINYNAGTPSSPNWATVNASNVLVAGVSISANPFGAICAGTSVTFTATPSSGISSPAYQWQLNGSNAGSNSASFSSSSLNNGDVVTCILSSSAPCVSGSPATSNSLTMIVNPAPVTPGSIAGSTTVCATSTGNVYSVSPVSGATSYNWTVPSGATITAGAGTTSITVTFGSATGSIGNVTVSSSNSCGTSSANSISISANPAAPAAPGAISGSSSAGNNSTGNVYSISSVTNATTYTWTVPTGSTITAGQGSTSITVTFGSTSGNISVTAGNSCGTSSASSLNVTLGCYTPGSQTFNYINGQQMFTVPNCVTSLTVTVYGAQGGSSSPNSGGLGGEAQATFSVTSGTTLYVYVGGAGSSIVSGTGGYNGGGNGGSGNYGVPGGGGSDVRMGGTALSNRIIVAGGGGGCTVNGWTTTGGAGGGLNGGDGISSVGANWCGKAGTQSGGGSPAVYSGIAGTSGQGGTGGGPGGGGGYYGGGGADAGGGGGGSGYVSPTGSSAVSYSSGVQSGNGQIVISW